MVVMIIILVHIKIYENLNCIKKMYNFNGSKYLLNLNKRLGNYIIIHH